MAPWLKQWKNSSKKNDELNRWKYKRASYEYFTVLPNGTVRAFVSVCVCSLVAKTAHQVVFCCVVLCCIFCECCCLLRLWLWVRAVVHSCTACIAYSIATFIFLFLTCTFGNWKCVETFFGNYGLSAVNVIDYGRWYHINVRWCLMWISFPSSIVCRRLFYIFQHPHQAKTFSIT